MGRQLQFVRHTIIVDDDFTLQNLQERDWFYFVERLIQVSQDEQYFLDANQNLEKNNVVIDTIENLVLSKSVYNVIYISIANSLYKYLKSIPKTDLDMIDSV